MVTKIGLDLGYANITLSNIAGEVYREPSVVLVDKKTRRVISVGDDAIGTEIPTDAPVMLVRPFKNGLLYSSDLTREIIRHAIRAIGMVDRLRCSIALPSDLVSKQEGEIFKMLAEAGVDECFSVNPAVAALVGAGYSPGMDVISVNIGASFTEIAVLHKGVPIITSRTEVGGENFDQAIKDYVFDQGDMAISLIMARTIKERLGAVWQGRPSETVDIEGTISLTGNRVKMSVSTEDVVGVFEKPLQMLLVAIGNTIKKIPYDKVEDIFANGIVLSGGGSEIFGLDTMVAKVFDIKTTLATSPIDCVAKGLARIHSFIPEKGSVDKKNVTAQLAKFYKAKKNSKTKMGES